MYVYAYTIYILHDSSAFDNIWRSRIQHPLICQFSSLYEACVMSSTQLGNSLPVLYLY